MSTTSDTPKLSKKGFKSDQDVRWCPGCGDYGILNSVQAAFAKLGKTLDDTVVISGIGCSSRFPYYMETYGFHSIHGRALSIATGVKLANPDLDVWVVTGDGDGLSIGGNHFIHTLRRNIGLKILLFNNRIYGLTKGQYSPTSEQGKRTKSTPMGSVDYPMRPVNLALGAGASFIARSVDMFGSHLEDVIARASAHDGTAFVEIYQNCNIFNDGAFDSFRERTVRAGRTVELRHGEPLLFGADHDHDHGLRLDASLQPEVVTLGVDGATVDDVMVWDEKAQSPGPAMALASMSERDFPVPIGVFRDTARNSLEHNVHAQIDAARAAGGTDLQELLNGQDTWTVA